jgi:hypothetical protein
VRSQSGQVNVQKRKSSRTRWVFWTMKMTSSPTPLREAIAPPPSRRPSAGGLVLSLGLSWTMTALLWCVGRRGQASSPSRRAFHIPDHAVRPGCSRRGNRLGQGFNDRARRGAPEVSSLCQPLLWQRPLAAWARGLLNGVRSWGRAGLLRITLSPTPPSTPAARCTTGSAAPSAAVTGSGTASHCVPTDSNRCRRCPPVGRPWRGVGASAIHSRQARPWCSWPSARSVLPRPCLECAVTVISATLPA